MSCNQEILRKEEIYLSSFDQGNRPTHFYLVDITNIFKIHPFQWHLFWIKIGVKTEKHEHICEIIRFQ